MCYPEVRLSINSEFTYLHYEYQEIKLFIYSEFLSSLYEDWQHFACYVYQIVRFVFELYEDREHNQLAIIIMYLQVSSMSVRVIVV